MTIQELLEATLSLEQEIDSIAPGSPELATILVRIAELVRELEATRSAQGSLIPDAAHTATAAEKSTAELHAALASLMTAAKAKR